MEFLCDCKYIVIPASHYAQNKRLYFYIDGKLVYDLVAALDFDNPDYHFPVNVERFKGQKIRVECDCDIDVCIEKTDTPELDYSGKYRPIAHFTAKRGWINDPNGLVFYNGNYLMFYQHNPVATTWGNMHWGAAVSKDLVHWQELDETLFPDENGTVFSGSAIVDKHNVSGLKQGEEDAILFFYTAAGGTSETSRGKLFTQCLAYSTDGGKTLVRYSNNPIIDNIIGENRDPKVIYYRPDDSYIMALFLDGQQFVLLKSKNLLNWTELHRITLPDDWECPDFYPLPLDGDDNSIKWIFSAAGDRYYIGSFNGDRYIPETELKRLNYGNASYASQSWSDVPDGRRIRTAFAKIIIPTMPFSCCMNIPQQMTLRTVNGEMCLCAQPVCEIENLYLNTASFDNIAVDSSRAFVHKVNSKCCDIALNVKCGASFNISLYGINIAYDSECALLKCLDKQAVVRGENGIVSLRIIIDTIYAEIFADSGSIFMGMTYIQDGALNKLTVSSADAYIENMAVSELGCWYDTSLDNS